jgi:GMP synthase (glutamine-hydrolysing)
MEDYAGLIIMGGPMGVYEEDRYPFLRAEMRLIEDALSEQKPILGVCLGTQLLAAALGASVTKGRQKEINWQPVALTELAATDTLCGGIPSSFIGYHWHGDVFELPRHAVSLASSKLTACQAFRHGPSAYGILFHAEVTRMIIERMAKLFRSELEEAGLDADQIIEGATEHLGPLQRIGKAVFHRWAQLIRSAALRSHSGSDR